jgi:hypothetical protein
MLKVEQTKDWVGRIDGVGDIEICENEFVRASFSNRLNPKQPHILIVHPIDAELVLRVRVLQLAKVQAGSELPRLVAHENYGLALGKVGISSGDGELMFEINHPCRNGDSEDPSPEVFARLVKQAMTEANRLALLATHVGMIEAGVPQEVARQFMAQFEVPEDTI